MKYPKFEQKVRERIVDSAERERTRPGYGIVIEYDVDNNTATVLMAHPGTDQPGEFFMNVPCPDVFGVQTVAPSLGKPCWVEFRDATNSNPVITHFFNHVYRETEYEQQYTVNNDVPRFLMEL